MKLIGLAAIAIALLLPLVWLPEIAVGRDMVALASQYLGMCALIAMAIGQLIATRWPGVELVFGPMDQSYRIHKWLGIGAMVAILLHDTIDAEMRGLGTETALVETAETLGEVSLYGLLILVVITIATFIPYHLWKWTHRLIGVFFVMGALHYLFILKPFANGDPLGLYMAAVCVIGLVAYIYTSAPRRFRPAQTYRITSVQPAGTALDIEMAPTGTGKIQHRAGQFAFFSFPDAGLIEPHPFTISRAPQTDATLRITVAPLGDMTSRLMRDLAKDQIVRVEGPFGHFGRTRAKPQYWVAAGVGVTPFLALAEALEAGNEPVSLLYMVRDRASAAHADTLRTLSAGNPNLSLEIWESASQGRLTPKAIAERVETSGHKEVLFCGPSGLRRDLADELRRVGIGPRSFHYEEFEIRTGLGLRAFAAWLWDRRFRKTSDGLADPDRIHSPH